MQDSADRLWVCKLFWHKPPTLFFFLIFCMILTWMYLKVNPCNITHNVKKMCTYESRLLPLLKFADANIFLNDSQTFDKVHWRRYLFIIIWHGMAFPLPSPGYLWMVNYLGFAETEGQCVNKECEYEKTVLWCLPVDQSLRGTVIICTICYSWIC